MKDIAAVKAATTLIKYCAQFEKCNEKCVFYNPIGWGFNDCIIHGSPWEYREIKQGANT